MTPRRLIFFPEISTCGISSWPVRVVSKRDVFLTSSSGWSIFASAWRRRLTVTEQPRDEAKTSAVSPFCAKKESSEVIWERLQKNAFMEFMGSESETNRKYTVVRWIYTLVSTLLICTFAFAWTYAFIYALAYCSTRVLTHVIFRVSVGACFQKKLDAIDATVLRSPHKRGFTILHHKEVE
jgi:hypothetical protein